MRQETTSTFSTLLLISSSGEGPNRQEGLSIYLWCPGAFPAAYLLLMGRAGPGQQIDLIVQMKGHRETFGL
jgi:hypothetical protein